MQALEGEVILKPTGTVHIANRLNLVERKLLNGLIWHAQKTRYEISDDEKEVRLVKIFELLGWSESHNTELVKSALETLVGTTIKWNVLGEDKTKQWGVCTFLSSAELMGGLVRYRINPKLAEKISSPVLYAKIQLLIESQLRKHHSLALYEFLVDYISRTRAPAKCVIEEISLPDLYKILGIGENEYQKYKAFNHYVLKPAIAEINSHTDLSVKPEARRQSRKVAGIRFHLEQKETYQIPLDFRKKSTKSVGYDPKKIKHEPESKQAISELLKQLTDLGIARRKAQQLIRQYSSEQIVDNIGIIKKRRDEGKSIDNFAALLIRAIEEDYRPQLSEENVEIEMKKAVQKNLNDRADVAQKLADEILNQYRKFQESISDKALSRLSSTEREKLEERFLASKSGRLWPKQYKENGLQSTAVRAAFYNYCNDNLHSDERLSLMDFALQQTKSKDVLQILERTIV